jgi:hypothetical protein
MKKNIEINFNNSYLSGLTQADGCFHISIELNKKLKLGVVVKPKIILSQHKNFKNFFELIKKYLGVGYIIINRNEVQYIVNSVPQIEQKIIPYFDKYPLRSRKLESYMIFKEIIGIISKKEHLTKEGLIKIIKMSYKMNTVTKRNENKKIKLFSMFGIENYKPINLTFNHVTNIIDIKFITGLIDGDGSFYISFNNKIRPGFNVTQDIANKSLLLELKEYFNCGIITELKSSKACRFQIDNLQDINSKLIPKLEKEIMYIKGSNFDIFKKVCFLLKNPLTFEIKKTIIELAYNMNNKGKYRKLSKNEYIKMFMNNPINK